MSEHRNNKAIFSLVIILAFLTIGVLNLILIHPVPGLFYMLFALMYCPHLDSLMKRRLNFEIPFYVKTGLAVIVIWGTLAVGDLAEMFDL